MLFNRKLFNSRRYLNVDYMLADVLMKTYNDDRKSTLRQASQLLESFLTRLDLYGLLSPADHKLLERYLENRLAFTIVSSSNPEERRKVKIARFQEEKALKQKLEVRVACDVIPVFILTGKYLRTQSQNANADEDVIRSLYLAEIALYVNQTFQSLDLITQESAILSQMSGVEPPPAASQQQSRDHRSPQRPEGYSERLDGPVTLAGLGRRGGPLLSTSGKPLQPFTLTDKRTQLRQGVFRPSHNLPTMTIDEYLEEERRRGGIIQGGGNANAPQPELDEDNMEQADGATMKAREWDEFVEANPKGAGNTLNRG